MVLVPLKQAITNNGWKQPRLIATDMDGTLRQQGKFTASLLTGQLIFATIFFAVQ